MNLRAVARRTRRLLPLVAVTLGVGGANLIANGSVVALAQSSCGATGGSSPPACGFSETGSLKTGDITSGDVSQLTAMTDPPAELQIDRNVDPGIECIYLGHPYQALSEDQYNVIVNGGSTTNQPTLFMTLSTAVSGGLRGAQLLIAEGKAQVCFGSPRPFTPKAGSPLLTTNDPGIGLQYVALLPDCRPASQNRPIGPCVSGRTATQLPTPTGTTGVVNMFITVPPGWDPRVHG